MAILGGWLETAIIEKKSSKSQWFSPSGEQPEQRELVYTL